MNVNTFYVKIFNNIDKHLKWIRLKFALDFNGLEWWYPPTLKSNGAKCALVYSIRKQKKNFFGKLSPNFQTIPLKKFTFFLSNRKWIFSLFFLIFFYFTFLLSGLEFQNSWNFRWNKCFTQKKQCWKHYYSANFSLS